MWKWNFAVLALFVLPVRATWQTVYNTNFSIVYIQSVNGSLYKLPISDQNVTESELESHMTQIASAPANASVVLDNDDHLFAVWGSKGCGSSPIEISQYDETTNQWSSVAQSNMKTQSWFQDSQIVWLDRSADQIYIYGGNCNGATQSGFYRFNLSNNTFEEIESQGKVMPRQMSNAQAVPLSDFQTLILGGRSGNAWMSMQQIAIWGHGSWTFDSVGNSTGIDSREDPLLLPIWPYGLNGTTGTVDTILVIGGTVAGRPANPNMGFLKYTDAEGWYWTVPNENSNLNVSYAATTLYTTLANLNSPMAAPDSTSSKSASMSNRISLFDEGSGSGWTSVQAVSVAKPAPAKQTDSSSSHSTSTATIAVVSTLLPIIVICLIGLFGWWWLRKRRERRLFLLPNRRSMLRRQPSTNSSMTTSNNWSSPSVQLPLSTTSIPPVPQNEADSGSIMMMESSEGNRLFMSKQRRNLRVVNPDKEDERSPHGSNSNSKEGSRESSWSSTSNVNPFSDRTENRNAEFDFGL